MCCANALMRTQRPNREHAAKKEQHSLKCSENITKAALTHRANENRLERATAPTILIYCIKETKDCYW